MSMCNVIGVLGDDEDEVWDTFRTAVDLADVERARLTLTKTCDDGRSYVWVTPFAFGGAYVPPPLDSPYEAERILARIAEFVPGSIPVTTHVLGPNTQEALVKLLRSGHYNALVASQDLLGHCRRLRRELRRQEIQTITVRHVCSEPGDDDQPAVPKLSPVAVDLVAKVDLATSH
jgi:hypothetical protein